MEGALLAFAGKAGSDHTARRLDAIPFDSRHRFMAVLTEGTAGRFFHVKGAPERVLRMMGETLAELRAAGTLGEAETLALDTTMRDFTHAMAACERLRSTCHRALNTP